MKLLIAIPSNRDWKCRFGASMLGLIIHLNAKGIPFEYNVAHNSSLLSRTRQETVDYALSKDFTHILFIDDDMAFVPTVFDLLASRDKQIIGVNSVVKNTSLRPTTKDKNGNRLSSVGKTSFEEVSYIGLGFSLAKTEIFKTIKKPHFEVKWSEELDDYLSEDYNLCKLLTEKDIKIFVDHDASRHMAHIGDFYYQENFN